MFPCDGVATCGLVVMHRQAMHLHPPILFHAVRARQILSRFSAIDGVRPCTRDRRHNATIWHHLRHATTRIRIVAAHTVIHPTTLAICPTPLVRHGLALVSTPGACVARFAKHRETSSAAELFSVVASLLRQIRVGAGCATIVIYLIIVVEGQPTIVSRYASSFDFLETGAHPGQRDP